MAKPKTFAVKVGKVSKETAGYENPRKPERGDERCFNCRFYYQQPLRDLTLCARVIGEVEPEAWSKIWKGKDEVKKARPGLPTRQADPIMGPPPSPNRLEYPYVGTINFQGLLIYVENAPGSKRSGTDKNGKPWSIRMKNYYGEIPGTRGADNDPVDVYVGPDSDAPTAWVFHQKHFHSDEHEVEGTYDEDKIMLGFSTKRDALKAYRAHLDMTVLTPGTTELPVSKLRDQLQQDNIVFGTITKATQAPADLSKADKPPGGGWEPIPKGRKGGFRRRSKSAKGYDYWYPEQRAVSEAKKWEVDPERTYKNLKAGDLVEVGGRRGIYRYVPGHGKTTPGNVWVQHQSTGAFQLVRKSTLTMLRPKRKVPPPPPIRRRKAPKPKAKVTAPRKAAKLSEGDSGAVQPSPKAKFAEINPTSNTAPGTTMWDIENGKVMLARYKDEKRKGWRFGIYLTDEQKGKLARFEADKSGRLVLRGELAPLIQKVVTDTIKRHNLNPAIRKDAVDDVMSAALVGMIMAQSRYTGGKSFGWLVKAMATTYATREVLNLMHAGTIPDHKLALVRGYIAAKHEARTPENSNPTQKEIAAKWRITKKHVFEGDRERLGKYREGIKVRDQSHEELPWEDWSLLDPGGKPIGKRKYLGKQALMMHMEAITSGASVKNSEWMEQHPGESLPTRGDEPAAVSALLAQDAHKILAKIPQDQAKALRMLFGFEPYSESKKRDEIATEMELTKKGASRATKFRAAGKLLDRATQAFKMAAESDRSETRHHIAKWAHAAPQVHVEPGNWGPAQRELQDRFGTPERVRIYLAAVRSGHGQRTAEILDKEKTGKATKAQQKRVRREFHAQRDKERLAAFRRQTQTREVDPSVVREVGAAVGTAAESPWLYTDTILSDYMTAMLKLGGE